jgi:hypothetical protein
MIDQIAKNVEGLAPQAYFFLASPELRIGRIEAKGRKQEMGLVDHCCLHKMQQELHRLRQNYIEVV